MFRHRQQLRRWAACVLFMWVFGLVASVAHACAVAEQAVPAGVAAGQAAALAPTGHPTLVHPHQDQNEHQYQHDAGLLPAHTDPAADHHGVGAKANCQDHCSKTAATIPPLKSALDDLQSHAGLTTAAAAAAPVPAWVPVLRWVPRRDDVRPPSVTIAFLRLTL